MSDKKERKVDNLIHLVENHTRTERHLEQYSNIGDPKFKNMARAKQYIREEQIELEADSRVDDKDIIHLGNLEFKIIHTPGHTKGGTCLYCEKEGCLFSGDTLFRGTWGRTDVPTGSIENIMESITKKLMILPDETIVYPGHGLSTRIKDEKPIYLELKPKLI